jgi:hypothetical protein
VINGTKNGRAVEPGIRDRLFKVLADGPLVPYRTGVMSEQNATLTLGETNTSEAPEHSGIFPVPWYRCFLGQCLASHEGLAEGDYPITMDRAAAWPQERWGGGGVGGGGCCS